METHQSLIEELEEFLAHQPTSSQNRDPGAWTWSPRHQWPPSPPTPSWTLWQVGRCTCLKTRTSPSPRRSCRAQCQPPASRRTMPRRMIQFNPRTLMFPKQHSREETFLLVEHLNFLKCFIQSTWNLEI